MNVPSRRSAVKPLSAMIAIAVAATPAGAAAQERGKAERAGADRPEHVREYKQVRAKVVKRFGTKKAGRHIVRDGYRENDGDVRSARKAEVVESTELMRGWLAPEPAGEAPAATASTTTEASTAGAPTSVIECESGGDYGAVNPAGYYGAYQFDQGTWDAYAPDGYAGTNPAEAPPEVQDAAAAAVPYDAWPNCP